MWPPFQASEGRPDDESCCHRIPSINHGDHGRSRHDQFRVSPFIFNSFYQVGTAVCRSCGRCHQWWLTTNIREISGSWKGVGWELGFGCWVLCVGLELGVFASIHTTNLPPPSPAHIPLAPLVPPSPPEPSYLMDISGLYWGYLGGILTISSPYILDLSHFMNTSCTLSQLVHHTCTLHLLNSYVK